MRRTMDKIEPPKRKVSRRKVSPLNVFRDYVSKPAGKRDLRTLLTIKRLAPTLEHHDPLDSVQKTKYRKQWQFLQERAGAQGKDQRLRFARLAWYALHDQEKLTGSAWRRLYALFTYYPGEVAQLLRERKKGSFAP